MQNNFINMPIRLLLEVGCGQTSEFCFTEASWFTWLIINRATVKSIDRVGRA